MTSSPNRPSTAAVLRRLESLDPAALDAHQLGKLNALLARVLPLNRFYADKLSGLSTPLTSLDELADIPFTLKDELLDTRPGSSYAANLTYDPHAYTRFHQTSGTRGRPLAVLDTQDDWAWWIDCWDTIFDAAEITDRDVAFMAFSFGPFVGFWSAHDAAVARGCLVIPGGGLTTTVRLEMLRSSQASVVFCTPSYALHLAEVAQQRQFDVGSLNVRVLILAGEPGGSIPAVRARIEEAWRARVFDHAGATEVGPWGFADSSATGLHVNESEFLAEFLSLETGWPAAEGELSELVLTTLGRAGCPVLRYRTGDLVRPIWQHDRRIRYVLLDGGVLGRADDMMIIRGVNIFPSGVEQILRSFPEVLEHRLTAYKAAEMDQLLVEIEDRLDQPARVADELRLRLGLRIDVRCVPLGSLPRFEGKGSRFVDQR